MARFFIAGTNFPNGRAIIRGRDADHIRVLRLRAGDDIVICDEGKKLFVTLGQFSIIKLERDIQLLMPAYDICMPEKDCSGSGGSDDPCDLFQKFKFPVDEFFPPKYSDYIKENGGNCQNGSCKTGKRC